MQDSESNSNTSIENTVRSFYEKAKDDILIGYFFQRLPDFDEHVEHITAFWHWQLIGAFSKKPRKPMRLIPAHLELNLAKGHLDRFVFLFKSNLEEKMSEGILTLELKDLWLAKLAFFEERLKSTPGMFRSNP